MDKIPRQQRNFILEKSLQKESVIVFADGPRQLDGMPVFNILTNDLKKIINGAKKPEC